MIDLVGAQHPELVERVAGVVQQVRVRRRGDGLAVVRLERGRDLFGVVDEVEDEGAVLVGVGAVQPGERLHGGETGQRLVDVHGVELWLVEAGLELLGHDHDLVLVGVEPLCGLRLGELVALGFRDGVAAVERYGVGERDEHAEVVAVVGDVGAQRFPEPNSVRPRRADHHRLRLAGDLLRDVGAEVLHDDLGLLGEVVLVESHEPGDRTASLRRSRRRGRR